MIMSNHANEAALEQIAEEVMELTVGDFLEELRHRKLHPPTSPSGSKRTDY